MVKFTSAIKTHLEEINVYRMFKKEDSQEKKNNRDVSQNLYSTNRKEHFGLGNTETV